MQSKQLCEEFFKDFPILENLYKNPNFAGMSDPVFCGKMSILQKLLNVLQKTKDKILLFSHSTTVRSLPFFNIYIYISLSCFLITFLLSWCVNVFRSKASVYQNNDKHFHATKSWISKFGPKMLNGSLAEILTFWKLLIFYFLVMVGCLETLHILVRLLRNFAYFSQIA